MMEWEQYKIAADNWQPSQDPLDYGPPSANDWWYNQKPAPEPAPGGWWYHHAPTNERARIQEHGLVPSNPNANPAWGDISQQPEGVYLVNRPEALKSTLFAEPNMPEMDTWRVPAEGLEVKRDPIIGDPAYYTPQHIRNPELFRP